MPSPRTLKTHLPVQMLPPSFWKQNSKVRPAQFYSLKQTQPVGTIRQVVPLSQGPHTPFCTHLSFRIWSPGMIGSFLLCQLTHAKRDVNETKQGFPAWRWPFNFEPLWSRDQEGLKQKCSLSGETCIGKVEQGSELGDLWNPEKWPGGHLKTPAALRPQAIFNQAVKSLLKPTLREPYLPQVLLFHVCSQERALGNVALSRTWQLVQTTAAEAICE